MVQKNRLSSTIVELSSAWAGQSEGATVDEVEAVRSGVGNKDLIRQH
ncbi:hypothetical protein [Tengunoibacter tsumagoiensis]|nr:hypothetical protein [Tengunoibacter tsumagoiensis]